MLPALQSAKTLSTFQKKVLAALFFVPKGSVTTYAALAELVECSSPRAIGQALSHNPFSPDIPCHRVVRSDGSLGGFFGGTALTTRKIALLAAEGVQLDPSGRVPEHIILRSLKKAPARPRQSQPLPIGDAK